MKIFQCAVTRSGQTTNCASLGCTENCRSLGGYNPIPIEVDLQHLAPFTSEDYARIERALEAGRDRAAHAAHVSMETERREAERQHRDPQPTSEVLALSGWDQTIRRVQEARRASRG